MAKDIPNKFVLGFMFTEDLRCVWLVRKARPQWQKGKLNGIGGKIKEGESPLNAMVRECHEESGVHIPGRDWINFATLDGGENFTVHCFTTHASDYSLTGLDANLDPEEPLRELDIQFHNLNTPAMGLSMDPEIPYLVPMAVAHLLRPDRLDKVTIPFRY